MKLENPDETDTLGSLEQLDPQAMLDLAVLVKRVSLDSRGLRVFPVVLVSLEGGTPGLPGSEESPETPVHQVCPVSLVFPERKAKISPALFPESWETPVILVSRDDQVLKGSLEAMVILEVLVLMDPKEREEILVMEANLDHKVSQDPEVTPVSQESRGPVLMVPVVRTVCLGFRERKASPGRCWGPLLELLGLTATLGPPETKASLGRPEDLEHLVSMGALVFPG